MAQPLTVTSRGGLMQPHDWTAADQRLERHLRAIDMTARSIERLDVRLTLDCKDRKRVLLLRKIEMQMTILKDLLVYQWPTT